MYSNSLVVLALSALASAHGDWQQHGDDASCSMHPMGANGWASALSAALPAMKTSNPALANAAQDFLAHASASSWEAPVTMTNTNTRTAQLAAPTSSVADAVQAKPSYYSEAAPESTSWSPKWSSTADAVQAKPTSSWYSESAPESTSWSPSWSSTAAAVQAKPTSSWYSESAPESTSWSPSWTSTANAVHATPVAIVMNGTTAWTTATDYATTTVCPGNSTVAAMSSVAKPVMASAMPSVYPINSANATATQTWAVNPVASDKPAAAKSSGLPVQNSGAEKIAGSALFGVVALAAFVL